jgi:hypothetical protein
MATRLNDEAMHHAESEPSTLTDLAGRKEGFDCMVVNFLRHPAARVGY